MLLIVSEVVNENECTNSEDLNMEAPQHAALGKENLDSFRNIPSYDNLNNVNKSSINDDEPMEVDQIPDCGDKTSTEDEPKQMESINTIVQNGDDASIPSNNIDCSENVAEELKDTICQDNIVSHKEEISGTSMEIDKESPFKTEDQSLEVTQDKTPESVELTSESEIAEKIIDEEQSNNEVNLDKSDSLVDLSTEECLLKEDTGSFNLNLSASDEDVLLKDVDVSDQVDNSSTVDDKQACLDIENDAKNEVKESECMISSKINTECGNTDLKLDPSNNNSDISFIKNESDNLNSVLSESESTGGQIDDESKEAIEQLVDVDDKNKDDSINEKTESPVNIDVAENKLNSGSVETLCEISAEYTAQNEEGSTSSNELEVTHVTEKGEPETLIISDEKNDEGVSTQTSEQNKETAVESNTIVERKDEKQDLNSKDANSMADVEISEEAIAACETTDIVQDDNQVKGDEDNVSDTSTISSEKEMVDKENGEYVGEIMNIDEGDTKLISTDEKTKDDCFEAPVDSPNVLTINEDSTAQSSDSDLQINSTTASKLPEITTEPMVLSDDEEPVRSIVEPSADPLKGDENSQEKIAGEDKNKVGANNDGNLTKDSKGDNCVSIDDEDDDIVLIDDSSAKVPSDKVEDVKDNKSSTSEDKDTTHSVVSETDSTVKSPKKNYKPVNISPLTIMKELKPKLSTMSREDLEEYVVVKIVESISGRSAISDIQMKLKTQEKSIEEWKRKVMSLTKQNKDLSIVLRNLCDEQQKRLKDNPLPIKITRSVGLQVGYPSVKTMNNSPAIATPISQPKPDKIPIGNFSRQEPKITKPPVQPAITNAVPPVRKSSRVKQATIATPTPSPAQSPIPIMSSALQTPPINSPVSTPTPHITVRTKRPNVPILPKLVPASSLVPNKNLAPTTTRSMLKNMQEPTRSAEKRPALQSIDLTDDEPPAKVQAVRTPPRPTPTIRPVNTSQLTNPNNKMAYVLNNSAGHGNRPVYIPINNLQQNSVVVRGGKVMNKVPMQNLRPIPSPMRVGQPIPIRPVGLQHPAPLPQSINSKTQLHPNWKWIPPRPTLKIARVDNGIVISWEMDDFSEVQHEPIASYQIFAYQEASTQPTTDLWKKIGDVKALPLPMACTLTHFMAGFKYYFAVRAIDIRTRVGPFSAPGQITLVNNKK